MFPQYDEEETDEFDGSACAFLVVENGQLPARIMAMAHAKLAVMAAAGDGYIHTSWLWIDGGTTFEFWARQEPFVGWKVICRIGGVQFGMDSGAVVIEDLRWFHSFTYNDGQRLTGGITFPRFELTRNTASGNQYWPWGFYYNRYKTVTNEIETPPSGPFNEGATGGTGLTESRSLSFRVGGSGDALPTAVQSTYYNKRFAAGAIAPSTFSGKLGLYIQSLLGRKLVKATSNEISLAPTYGQPSGGFGFVGTGRMPTLQLDTATYLSCINFLGCGLHTDSRYNYSLIWMPDDSLFQDVVIKITPLKDTIPAAQSVRNWLLSTAGQTATEAQQYKAEAFLLSQVRPNYDRQFTIQDFASSGSFLYQDTKNAAGDWDSNGPFRGFANIPFTYGWGWKFSENGRYASRCRWSPTGAITTAGGTPELIGDAGMDLDHLQLEFHRDPELTGLLPGDPGFGSGPDEEAAFWTHSTSLIQHEDFGDGATGIYWVAQPIRNSLVVSTHLNNAAGAGVGYGYQINAFGIGERPYLHGNIWPGKYGIPAPTPHSPTNPAGLVLPLYVIGWDGDTEHTLMCDVDALAYRIQRRTPGPSGDTTDYVGSGVFTDGAGGFLDANTGDCGSFHIPLDNAACIYFGADDAHSGGTGIVRYTPRRGFTDTLNLTNAQLLWQPASWFTFDREAYVTGAHIASLVRGSGSFHTAIELEGYEGVASGPSGTAAHMIAFIGHE